MRNYTCIVVDDEPEVRKRLKNLLEKVGNIEVLSTEGTVDGAITSVVDTRPDIVLMDIEMPGMNGFDIINSIRSRSCFPEFIIVTAYNQYAIRAIREAAFDFLLKPVDIAELNDAIKRFDKKQAGTPISSKHPLFGCLSQREKEIAGLLIKGLSSRKIAEELFLSRHTVDTHRRNILHKLRLKSTMDLIRKGA